MPFAVEMTEDVSQYNLVIREQQGIGTRIAVEKSHGVISVFRNGILIHGGQMGTTDTVIPAYPVRCITEAASTVPSARFNFPLKDQDAFYGLGDKTGRPNRRGRQFKMSNHDALGYDAGNSDPLYKSVPYFLKWNKSSGALCGLFFPEALVNDIDLGRESSFFFSVGLQGGPFSYYVLLGDNYRRLMNGYCRVNGFPVLPSPLQLRLLRFFDELRGAGQCR